MHRTILSSALLVVCVAVSLSTAAPFVTKKVEPRPTAKYFSAQLHGPPLPFNPFPSLDLLKIAEGEYCYNDRDVDYLQLRRDAQEAAAKAAPAGGPALSAFSSSGGGMAMMSQGGLRLVGPVIDSGAVHLQITGHEPGARHDLYASTNLGSTNAWLYLGRSGPDQTNLVTPLLPGSVVAFSLGTLDDTDEDTLPDAFEMRVTHTSAATPDTAATAVPGSLAAAWLNVQPASISVKSFERKAHYILTEDTGHVSGWIEEAGWTNGVGGERKSFGLPRSNPAQTNLVWSYTWDAAGQPSDPEGWAMPPNMPFFMACRHRTPPEWGVPWVEDIQDLTSTGIELDTGGPPLSTNKGLMLVTVQAIHWDNWLGAIEDSFQVPPTNITVLGQALDASGQVWKELPDHTKLDATPAAASQYTNYVFSVAAQRVRLGLRYRAEGRFTTNEITGTEQRVWIGERPTLEAFLDPEMSGWSNITWSVPGVRQADYIHTDILGSNVPLTVVTQAAVTFVWTQPAPSHEVTCTAQIGGHTLTAKAKFEVKGVEADWNAERTGTIRIQRIGGTDFLRLAGDGAPGIEFRFANGNVNGYPDTWRHFWTQIGSSIHWRLDGGLTWHASLGAGLDTRFVARAWTNSLAGDSGDNPSVTLYEDDALVWRGNEFDTYLFFQPSPPSIPVVLKKLHWKWLGHAFKNATEWVVVEYPPPSPVNSTNVTITMQNTPVFSNPVWTNNITARINFETNQAPNLP